MVDERGPGGERDGRQITANGHPVYGVYTTSNFDNSVGAVGYRNNSTKGVATATPPKPCTCS